MKKLLASLMALSMVFAVTGCSESNDSENESKAEAKTTTTTTTTAPTVTEPKEETVKNKKVPIAIACGAVGAVAFVLVMTAVIKKNKHD